VPKTLCKAENCEGRKKKDKKCHKVGVGRPKKMEKVTYVNVCTQRRA